MKYKLRLTSNAVEDINRHKKSGNKKQLQKIEALLEELLSIPTQVLANPRNSNTTWKDFTQEKSIENIV